MYVDAIVEYLRTRVRLPPPPPTIGLLLSTFWVLYVASFFLDGAIETKLHERQGKSINNFDITLPPYDSDMANQIFKDPYCLIFSALTILVEKQN